MAVLCFVVPLLLGCFAVATSSTGNHETFNVKPDGKLAHTEVKLVTGLSVGWRLASARFSGIAGGLVAILPCPDVFSASK